MTDSPAKMDGTSKGKLAGDFWMQDQPKRGSGKDNLGPGKSDRLGTDELVTLSLENQSTREANDRQMKGLWLAHNQHLMKHEVVVDKFHDELEKVKQGRPQQERDKGGEEAGAGGERGMRPNT